MLFLVRSRSYLVWVLAQKVVLDSNDCIQLAWKEHRILWIKPVVPLRNALSTLLCSPILSLPFGRKDNVFIQIIDNCIDLLEVRAHLHRRNHFTVLFVYVHVYVHV